jgi:hypothetical protein
MEKIGNVKDVPSVDEVILGVDTHVDLHVAVALDQLGRRLREITVPTSTRGYARLLRWAEGMLRLGHPRFLSPGVRWPLCTVKPPIHATHLGGAGRVQLLLGRTVGIVSLGSSPK